MERRQLAAPQVSRWRASGPVQRPDNAPSRSAKVLREEAVFVRPFPFLGYPETF